MDDIQKKYEVMDRPPVTTTGSESENLNPGLAVLRKCADWPKEHPDSHPNGENLLMFLEKDWTLYPAWRELDIEGLFRGANALTQRGVSYIRLMRKLTELDNSKTWMCPSNGVPFRCTTSHQHRWSNQPFIVKCDWFLRYLDISSLVHYLRWRMNWISKERI